MESFLSVGVTGSEADLVTTFLLGSIEGLVGSLQGLIEAFTAEAFGNPDRYSHTDSLLSHISRLASFGLCLSITVFLTFIFPQDDAVICYLLPHVL